MTRRFIQVAMLTLAMAVHGEATCAADVEGAYSYALVAAGEPCVRLIHRVFSEDGAMIGDPLVRDIAFGISSEESPGTVVDCLPDSLRDAAAAYKRVNLSYSSAWKHQWTSGRDPVASRMLSTLSKRLGVADSGFR